MRTILAAPIHPYADVYPYGGKTFPLLSDMRAGRIRGCLVMLLALDIHGSAMDSVDQVFPGDGADAKSTILIAARNGSHRRTLAGFLRQNGHAVVTTDNEEDAITLAQTGDIDLVVTGHTMPGICGHELTRKLRKILPVLPVLLMSAGAEVLSNAFLDFVTALGGSATPVVEQVESSQIRNCGGDPERLICLTSRERQVLDLVTAGHGNKAAARLLAISPRTVENHRARIMRKTSSRSLAELVHLSLLDRRSSWPNSKIMT